MASDDELLVLRLDDPRGLPRPEDASGRRHYAGAIRERLGQTLPEGMAVHEVELLRPGVSFQPVSAVYRFRLAFWPDSGRSQRLEERIEELEQHDALPIERSTPGRRRVRRIDLRPFLRSAELTTGHLAVCCNVTMAGSMRLEEVMQLFELDMEDLTGPVQRTDVQWALS